MARTAAKTTATATPAATPDATVEPTEIVEPVVDNVAETADDAAAVEAPESEVAPVKQPDAAPLDAPAPPVVAEDTSTPVRLSPDAVGAVTTGDGGEILDAETGLPVTVESADLFTEVSPVLVRSNVRLLVRRSLGRRHDTTVLLLAKGAEISRDEAAAIESRLASASAE